MKKDFKLLPIHFSFITTVIIIAIIIFASLISLKFYKRYDLTITKKYSLAEQTVNVLEGLDRQIKAIGFYTPEHQEKEKTALILELFSETTKRFKSEIINPEKNPGRTRKYGKIMSGTVVVESGELWEKIKKPTESSILSAILRISSEEKKSIYFIGGHGERPLNEAWGSGFKRAQDVLESQGFNVFNLNLLETERVPEQADVVVVTGPKKDFFAVELDKLNQYLQSGGAILLLIDPNNLPNIEAFCIQLGVNIGDGVIIDKSRRVSGTDFVVTVVNQYSSHEITEEIDSITIFPLSRSVEVSRIKSGDIRIGPLAKTGDESWLETDLISLFNRGIAEFDNLRDRRGPITIALAGEARNIQKQNQSTSSRFVVIGDSDFATNTYFDQGANGDLFVNSILWLNKEKDLIAYRPFDQEFFPIVLTKSQLKLLFWITVVAMPVIALSIGVFVIRRVRWRS